MLPLQASPIGLAFTKNLAGRSSGKGRPARAGMREGLPPPQFLTAMTSSVCDIANRGLSHAMAGHPFVREPGEGATQ
jgi:hypothetical protein